MQVIVFEDERVSNLFPLTLARPAYALLCASFRLIDLIETLTSSPRSLVRNYLYELQTADYPGLEPVDTVSTSEPTLWVNARLVPSRTNYETLRELSHQEKPAAVRANSAIAAVVFPANIPPIPENLEVATLDRYLSECGIDELPTLSADLDLLDYPHQLVYYNQETLGDNLDYRLREGSYREIDEGVFSAEKTEIGEHVVTDTRKGPVVLENRARIGPHTFLRGPVHVGARARVTDHAAIKDASCIAHTTKIGGEIEACVVEAYTNKQHHGFLGHSYLGSWINLGAGTCNSDLKNTYGKISMEYAGQKVSTGLQFLGCVMGDYTKTAINTGIFTGKVIGACSMLYGFVTTNVPSFVNYARLFGQVSELPLDVMISMQRRMFARRKVIQRDCDAQLIREMYRLTCEERQVGGNHFNID